MFLCLFILDRQAVKAYNEGVVKSQCEAETFAECSILFKFKEGENFNHRNILDISRIKI
jgi:hypothetical protein